MRKSVIAVIVIWWALIAASVGVWYYVSTNVPLLSRDTPGQVYGPMVWTSMVIAVAICCMALVAVSGRTNLAVAAGVTVVAFLGSTAAGVVTIILARAAMLRLLPTVTGGAVYLAWGLIAMVCAIEIVLITGSVCALAQSARVAHAHA